MACRRNATGSWRFYPRIRVSSVQRAGCTRMLLPLPVTLLVLVATGLAFALPAACADAVFLEGLPRPVVAALVPMMAWSMRVVPFAAAAVLFARAYMRSGASAWWFVATAAQILPAAALFDCRIRAGTEPGKSSITMGFTLYPGNHPPLIQFLSTHLLQVAAPLAIGMMMLQAARRRHASPGEPRGFSRMEISGIGDDGTSLNSFQRDNTPLGLAVGGMLPIGGVVTCTLDETTSPPANRPPECRGWRRLIG